MEGRPVVVRLPESVLRVFFPPPVTLIDPTGSGVNPADVKAAVIRFPDDELRLERDLERWIATEYGAQATTEIVDSFLENGDSVLRIFEPDVVMPITVADFGIDITASP